MSPRFDDIGGSGALSALEADLAHPTLGSCRIREFPDASFAQAPRDAAVLGIAWERRGRASAAADRHLWFFNWLDAGGGQGAGLIAHLALVLEKWGVREVRCVPASSKAETVLRHCGFQSWAEGPLGERHLLTGRISDGAAYARNRHRESRPSPRWDLRRPTSLEIDSHNSEAISRVAGSINEVRRLGMPDKLGHDKRRDLTGGLLQ